MITLQFDGPFKYGLMCLFNGRVHLSFPLVTYQIYLITFLLLFHYMFIDILFFPFLIFRLT